MIHRGLLGVRAGLRCGRFRRRLRARVDLPTGGSEVACRAMRSVVAALAAGALLAISSTAPAAGESERLLWSGAFEGGLSAWTGVQAREGGVTVVPAPGRVGVAARFLVRPGDVPIGTSGERAEVLQETGEQAGIDSFWAWSVYFPPGSASSPDTSWNVFTQWHQSISGGVQPLSFEITNNKGVNGSACGHGVAEPTRRRAANGGLLRSCAAGGTTSRCTCGGPRIRQGPCRSGSIGGKSFRRPERRRSTRASRSTSNRASIVPTPASRARC